MHSQTVQYQYDAHEQQRLKQILFPHKSKTRSSRATSSIYLDCSLKQNQQYEHNQIITNRHNNNHHNRHHYSNSNSQISVYTKNRTTNIKQQIIKLKQGIQAFMDRQALTDNFITTPRQCLELIKCMSQGMNNYQEEIQEAIGTLLESIPRNYCSNGNYNEKSSNSKYFITSLKLAYLSSIFTHIKKHNMSISLKSLTNYSKSLSLDLKNQQQRHDHQHRIHIQNCHIKKHKYFKRWHLKILKNRTKQHQQYQQQYFNTRILNMIKLLANQGKMVIYLEGLLRNCSDNVQILLYDAKRNTLRSYKSKSQGDGLASVFQAVECSSRMSQVNGNNNNIQSNREYHNDGQQQGMLTCRGTGTSNRNLLQFPHKLSNIRRLQFRLQHSLTKISLIKKQIILSENMRRDPDYGSIDDYTIYHGLSARENLGGCILTPIISKSNNQCIGIIRQYFYNKIGCELSSQTIKMVSEMLQNSINTSAIFQELQGQNSAIRSKNYIKAVEIINYMESISLFTNAVQEKFNQLMARNFMVSLYSCYGYSTKASLDSTPHFTIHNNTAGIIESSLSSHEPSKKQLTTLIVCLSKMYNNKTDCIYQNNFLHIALNSKIYTFSIITPALSASVQLQSSTSTSTSQIPIQILKQLLTKKHSLTLQKQQKHKQYLLQKQKQQQKQLQRKQKMYHDQVISFCIQKINNVKNKEKFIGVLKEFIGRFWQQNVKNIYIMTKNNNSISDKNNNNDNKQTKTIFQNDNFKIQAKFDQLSQKQLNLPTQTSQLLNTLCTNIITNLSKPISKTLKFPSTLNSLLIKSQLYYNNDQNNIYEGFINFIKDIFGIQKQKQKQNQDQKLTDEIVSIYRCNNNPYTMDTYCCYLPSKNDNINTIFDFQDKNVLKDGKQLQRRIRNQGIMQSNIYNLQPLDTILCLNNSIFIKIHQYISLTQLQFQNIAKIYKKWQNKLQKTQQNIKNTIKLTKISTSICKLSNIIINKYLKPTFYAIKIIKPVIRYLPNLLLRNYIDRENRRLVHYSFNCLIKKARDNCGNCVNKVTLDYGENYRKLCVFVSKVYLVSPIKHFYSSFKRQKQLSKALNRLNQIILSSDKNHLNSALTHISLYPNLKLGITFYPLTKILTNSLKTPFNILKTHSKTLQSLSLTFQPQTQCSIISKQQNLYKISEIIKQKYKNYHIFLYLKQNVYLQISPQVKICEQLSNSNSNGMQFYQFCMQTQNQSQNHMKSQIKNVIWLVPQSTPITLIEKHYLQVLSRAIDESYTKHIYKTSQFLTALNNFFKLKSQKILQKSFKIMINYSMNQLKVQQYRLRNKFYETSIEVENYKLNQKQQKKQQQNRAKQIQNILQTKKKYEDSIKDNRGIVIRMEILSRQLQAREIKQRIQGQRKQFGRLFNIWRVQTAYTNKYAMRRQLARKRQQFSCNKIYKIFKLIVEQNLKQSLNKITIFIREKFQQQVKKLQQKIIKQQLQLKQKQNKCHGNRLLTFQDQFNDCNEECLSQCQSSQQNQQKVEIGRKYININGDKNGNTKMKENTHTYHNRNPQNNEISRQKSKSKENHKQRERQSKKYHQNETIKQKQMSIIPISFKHFQSSKKQNYDVTDQQSKKMNGGAYKLNAKTLKFLKRMGKLNNNDNN